jgi:translation initiation factor IF-3
VYLIRNRDPRQAGKGQKKTEINEMIRDREIRVIDENGEQLGMMSSRDAFKLAQERKLDLVKIAPQAKPPVCKIMDYGKHKYEMQKKEKEAKKKQKTVQIKEVRLSLKIDKHDLETKANNAKKFLGKGDKVKVSLRFKGREMGHTRLGYEVFDRFAETIGEDGKMEGRPKMEGRQMIVFFIPAQNN